MKIAIVGSGISGLATAHYLSGHHPVAKQVESVTVFEAADRPGGHTDTHQFEVDGKSVTVDSGFIVFNEHNYPLFTQMLRQLGVQWQISDMSFSATNEATGFCYGAAGFDRLFAQKKQLVNPQFYRMIWDTLRFYRAGRELVKDPNLDITLGDYLAGNGYSNVFRDNHIVPMASALWSAPASQVESFPLQYMLSFMANHNMLAINGRPIWKTIVGGSNQYVGKIIDQLNGELRLNQPVQGITRQDGKVIVHTTNQEESFDALVLACHSDQALSLLLDPTAEEQSVLGAIEYQDNQVVVHTDERFMPPKRAAWASWNARVSADQNAACSVSYWMNLLQNIPVPTPIVVTLNPAASALGSVEQHKILTERHYAHPVYTRATIQAQQQHSTISGGRNNTYYCGAYWGWGFHEDGVRSARVVADQLEHASC